MSNFPVSLGNPPFDLAYAGTTSHRIWFRYATHSLLNSSMFILHWDDIAQPQCYGAPFSSRVWRCWRNINIALRCIVLLARTPSRCTNSHARTQVCTHVGILIHKQHLLIPYMHYYTRRRIIVIYETVILLCKMFAYCIHYYRRHYLWPVLFIFHGGQHLVLIGASMSALIISFLYITIVT